MVVRKIVCVGSMSTIIRRCAGCGMQVKKGKFVREQLTETYFHYNCFKCKQCKTFLWGESYVLAEFPDVHCRLCRTGPNVVDNPDPYNFGELDENGDSIIPTHSEQTHVTLPPRVTETVELTLPPPKKPAGNSARFPPPLESEVVEEVFTLTLPPPKPQAARGGTVGGASRGGATVGGAARGGATVGGAARGGATGRGRGW